MKRTSIEWTEATWNPVVGCTKVSPGCKHCYAEVMHRRLTEMGSAKYAEPFKVVKPWEPHLKEPLRWTKPRLIFVNSMSDLFHDDIPLTYIQQVFAVMCQAYWHQFQVLTKRAERLEAIAPELQWPGNVWMGVSVESDDYIHRIDHLRRTDAAVKFLSLEPLLGPLSGLDLDGIDWVIVGGESGRRPRPIDEEWVTEIRDQCLGAGVAFFFKQWGGTNKKKAGRVLDGRTWSEMPQHLAEVAQ